MNYIDAKDLKAGNVVAYRLGKQMVVERVRTSKGFTVIGYRIESVQDGKLDVCGSAEVSSSAVFSLL